MKTLKIAMIFCIIITYCSCRKTVKINMSDAEEILIDAKHRTDLSLDSIIKNLEYIKLETTGNCNIKAIGSRYLSAYTAYTQYSFALLAV